MTFKNHSIAPIPSGCVEESWKDLPPLRGVPIAPTPRTTLRTTPRTTLRTTPRPTPWTAPRITQSKEPNLRLRGKETQEAYLLHLHDHNCMKNSRHFLFTVFLDPVFFIFSPFFRMYSWIEYFIFYLLQVFVIDIDICWKQLWEIEFIGDEAPTIQIGELNWFHDIFWQMLMSMANTWGRLETDIQHCLPIETAFWLVADEEMGRKWKKTGSRKSVKIKWRLFVIFRVVGTSTLLVSLFLVSVNFVVYYLG